MIRRLTEKLHIHYAWLILSVCCALFGASMGLINNCASLYTADILSDLGWTLSFMTVLDISNTVSRLFATAWTDRIFRRLPLKPVLAGSILVLSLSCMAKGLVKNAAGYILISVLFGLSSAFLFYVPVPMLLNSWFVKKRDTALGIAMLCSGLFPALASPLFSSVMEAYGWRTACAVNGLAAALLAVPPVLLFAVKTPEELGMKPYGWEEAETAAEEKKSCVSGVRFSPEETRKRFLLSSVLALLLYGVSYAPARLPHFASTSGLGASLGSLMLSADMFGNMAGKGITGPLSDRFGPRKAYTASIALVFISLLVLCFMPSSTAVLLPAAFFSGISSSNGTMVFPAAVRTYSDGDEYTKYVAKVSMAFTVFSTPFSLLLGVLYDTSLSYFSTFLLLTVMDAAACVLCLVMFPKEGNQ